MQPLTPPKLAAKYRPSLTAEEITCLIEALRTVPRELRTPIQTAAFYKLSKIAYKISEDLVAPAYVATASTLSTVQAELNASSTLSKAELAIAAKLESQAASRKLTKEQEWAYCWDRFKSGYMLTPSELANALEHAYLNFTLPADLVSATESLLSAEAFTNEVVAAIKKVLDEAVVLARLDI